MPFLMKENFLIHLKKMWKHKSSLKFKNNRKINHHYKKTFLEIMGNKMKMRNNKKYKKENIKIDNH